MKFLLNLFESLFEWGALMLMLFAIPTGVVVGVYATIPLFLSGGSLFALAGMYIITSAAFSAIVFGVGVMLGLPLTLIKMYNKGTKSKETN